MRQIDQQALIKELIAGFGHLNKKDYEVAIFHYMIENELKNETDFAISRKLRIAETKVKQLRYESNLAYGQDNDDEYFKTQFYDLLQRSTFKPVGENKMQFAINDKMLRLYLHDKLARYGSFADSSFNSSTVIITASDMIILLVGFEKQQEILGNIEKQLKVNGKIEPNKMSQDTKNKIISVLKGIGKTTLKITLDWLLNYLTNGL